MNCIIIETVKSKPVASSGGSGKMSKIAVDDGDGGDSSGNEKMVEGPPSKSKPKGGASNTSTVTKSAVVAVTADSAADPAEMGTKQRRVNKKLAEYEDGDDKPGTASGVVKKNI